LSEPDRNRRRTSPDSRLPVPKNAVAVGIIIGGVLGVLLGWITLRIVRGPAAEPDPADLAPIRVVAPRAASPTPSPTAR
jgi:hypothetical protein